MSGLLGTARFVIIIGMGRALEGLAIKCFDILQKRYLSIIFMISQLINLGLVMLVYSLSNQQVDYQNIYSLVGLGVVVSSFFIIVITIYKIMTVIKTQKTQGWFTAVTQNDIQRYNQEIHN